MTLPGKTRAKAAAWSIDGTLAVLVARGRKTACLMIAARDRRVITELPAAAEATRVAVLDDGSVLTLANKGTGKLARADAARSASVKCTVKDLAVCHGVAHVVGPARAVWRLDPATATWSSMGLREALRPILPERAGGSDSVHSIVEGAHGPIVGVHANSLRETLVLEWTGESWRLRGRAPWVHALARSPDDVVYTIGDQVHAIDARGRLAQVADANDQSWWSGGFVTGGGGSLLVATLASVLRVGPRGKLATLLPWGDGQVPHNHSLFTRGPHAAFVRAGQLHVLVGERFDEVPLE